MKPVRVQVWNLVKPTSDTLRRVDGQILGEIEILIKDKIDLRHEEWHTLTLFLAFPLGQYLLLRVSCQTERN